MLCNAYTICCTLYKRHAVPPRTVLDSKAVLPPPAGMDWCTLPWLVICRSKEYLPESINGYINIVLHFNYLGSDQASVTLNLSRGAGMITAQYYQVYYSCAQ